MNETRTTLTPVHIVHSEISRPVDVYKQRDSDAVGVFRVHRDEVTLCHPSGSIAACDTLPVLEDPMKGRESRVLNGNAQPLPTYLLGRGYQSNSYFACKLRDCMLLLCTLDTLGIVLYYRFNNRPEDTGLKVLNFWKSLALRSEKCAPHVKCDTNCTAIVVYATMVFHMLPIVILLGLPATGWRAFEPFYRNAQPERTQQDGIHSAVTKIRRTFYLQFCEALGVMVLAINVVVLFYFLWSLFQGRTFSCSESVVQLYALGAFGAYCLTFTQLRYFARFREHIKMQLGAFKESDHSGDIRSRFGGKLRWCRSELTQSRSTLRKQLYKAAKVGDLTEIEKLISKGQQLFGVDFGKWMYRTPAFRFFFFGKSNKNPMHTAAQKGNVTVMKMLHAAHFSVNSLDKVMRVRFTTGDFFWYFAQVFVSRPAASYDETATTVFRTTLVTPLHCAVARGQIESVKWLIEHDANVNLFSKSSYWSERVPPIFLADNAEIVRILMQAGANHLQIPDPGRMNTLTALQLAYLRGNIPIAYELEQWGGDVALTPLHAAAASNKVNKVRKLLKARADANCLGEQGYQGFHRRTPLHWGAVNGMQGTVELLLERGADPNFQDAKGRTPLHWAARTGRSNIIELLTSRGANVQLRDSYSMVPLHCAAQFQNTSKEGIKHLVNAGADINEQLPNGDTPLHIAVKKEHLETSLALLSCGADLMMTNHDGFRPLDCTTATNLQYEIKRAAGKRDVMISYTHSHSEFAKRLRKNLEDASITTWLDLMDPSGIGGGAVWREEIARGITNAVLVVAIITEDYPKSEWCLKELAVAREVGTPIIAVSTENTAVDNDLKNYINSSAIVSFEPSIINIDMSDKRNISYTYDEGKYTAVVRNLLVRVQEHIAERTHERVSLSNRRRLKSIAQQNGQNGIFYMPENVQDGQVDLESPFVIILHGDHHLGFVMRLADQLLANGFRVCIEGPPDNVNWDLAIRNTIYQAAVTKCSAVLPILAKEYSGNELIQSQMNEAARNGRCILPVMLNLLELGFDKQYTFSRMRLHHFTPRVGFSTSFNNLLLSIQDYIQPKRTRI
uniref:Uncharacterized protein AlNc14C4G623 n=1 Tax=Albugo laibachii Nc14 TaxID=890382 RepID=F0W0I1_9STRA|nr:conserved hypothetical protein [Albugo laibachii Nc14]|eukprot:CCA14553.1 conserved hypothetical protein [Albugo laibachii Nc14]